MKFSLIFSAASICMVFVNSMPLDVSYNSKEVTPPPNENVKEGLNEVLKGISVPKEKEGATEGAAHGAEGATEGAAHGAEGATKGATHGAEGATKGATEGAAHGAEGATKGATEGAAHGAEGATKGATEGAAHGTEATKGAEGAAHGAEGATEGGAHGAEGAAQSPVQNAEIEVPKLNEEASQSPVQGVAAILGPSENGEKVEKYESSEKLKEEAKEPNAEKPKEAVAGAAPQTSSNLQSSSTSMKTAVLNTCVIALSLMLLF
ncbi:hypothetical protein HDU92_008958 [Lobulomyces angularis]|nr:hypothetical protein HDU92_008958 [Lobulomyces angularis]